jgi:hypothetical protein
MRPLVAHCHLGLGQLYGQISRGEQAHAALSAAIDLYRSTAILILEIKTYQAWVQAAVRAWMRYRDP